MNSNMRFAAEAFAVGLSVIASAQASFAGRWSGQTASAASALMPAAG